MKKIIFLLLLAGCISCAPRSYTAQQIYVGKDGTEQVRERRMKNETACHRKARRQARKRARWRDHNANYGITSMGGARERR